MEKINYIGEAEERLDDISRLSYQKMCMIHTPPHRALYGGGAGIAYAFWRAACILEKPRWLQYSRLWIDHVMAAPQDQREVDIPESSHGPLEYEIEDSLYWGDRGISLVRALIAYSEDDAPMFERALESYMEPEQRRVEQQELMQGIGGRLLGTALLLDETGEEKLKPHGDKLAEELLATAGSGNGSIPWKDNHLLGMAHGRAGNYFALLNWAGVTGFSLPDWFFRGLEEYARSGRKRREGISWPIDERDEGKYMDSWCNGAPGLILLWNLACRHTGDPLYLDTAREAARYVVNIRDPLIGYLCCGAAGVVYSMLNMHRNDPGGPWLDHAGHLLEAALEGRMSQDGRISLFLGSAGIACLLVDMEDPGRARMPAVEI